MSKDWFVNILCKLGNAFSHAVGHTPEHLKELRETGMDSISRQRREEQAELGTSSFGLRR